MAKTEPRTLPGFMELLPSEQILFNQMKSTIEDTYKRFGFLPLDTPVIELSEVLLAKAGGETEKQIYRFNKGDHDLSLRFDLTVPLAKYVAKNYGNLSFPFRRYQIGKVYRGERTQKGRFREFYQCDIDIIGDGELDLINDAELPSVIYTIFTKLGFQNFTIRINNRKILNGLFESLKLNDKATEILRIIDKIDKIGKDAVIEELEKIEVNKEAINKIMEFIAIEGTSDEKLEKLKELKIENETYKKGVEELEYVVKHMRLFEIPENNFSVDLTIARGLDYYTGTVYETFLNDYRELGSVCSGGRYENLAEHYTDKKLPGVGISIGLTRLFYKLNEMNLIKADKKSVADVLIIPMVEDLSVPIKIANKLRKEGKNTEIYLNNKLISSNNVTGVAISKSITVDESKSFYNISVIYKGNNKYSNSSNSVILRISSLPLETLIISKDLTKYYKNGTHFDIILKDVLGNVLVNKEVKITINGVTYKKITDTNGKARLSINLLPGVYNITTSFEDDGNYVKSLNTNKIVVLSKIITKFVDNNKFIVKLVNDDGTPKTNASLAIIANGVQYNRITNSSGEARLNVRLNPSNYIFTVTDGLEVVSSPVHVLSTIRTSDISMFYKDGTRFAAKLYDANGKIVSNKEVAITVNGVTYNKLTDSKGVAYLNINLNPGVYSISTSYEGKTVYNTILISAMPVTIVSSSIHIQQGTFYKVKFSDALSNPIIGQKVGIFVNGVMYYRETDDLGVASLKINLNPGHYMITSGLLSNAYEAKTMNNIITVSGGYL